MLFMIFMLLLLFMGCECMLLHCCLSYDAMMAGCTYVRSFLGVTKYVFFFV